MTLYLVRQTRFELARGVLLITGTPLRPRPSAFTDFATAATDERSATRNMD